MRKALISVKLWKYENTFSTNDIVMLLAGVLVIIHEAQEEVFTFFWEDEIVIRALIPSQRPQAGYMQPDLDAVSHEFSNRVMSTYTTSSILKNNPPTKGSSREDIGGWLGWSACSIAVPSLMVSLYGYWLPPDPRSPICSVRYEDQD